MFDKVLDMPLDHLNCFAVALRGIQGKVNICKTDYRIHSKQGIFPYSHVIHRSIYNNQANKRFTMVKEKKSTTKLGVFVLSVMFFFPTYQIKSFINRSGTCYILHVSKQWHSAGECFCNCMYQMETTE